ncbi:hypothetical protein FAI40_03770 [Acetobacteraceae bacterium]|nr:hypothetical protein FAI40_03770 [Acetobacteraceae bacterium]
MASATDSPLKAKIAQNISWLIPLTLLIWAVLLRFMGFGDQLLSEHANWYMYVGGQIFEGSFPYVDIWDRKPFLQFFICGFFALFGPYRFWAASFGATLFAWGTSYLLYKIGESLCSRKGGFTAALFYLPLLSALGGYGGREAVLYNFFVTLGFALFFLRYDRLKKENGLRLVTGALAMVSLGIAIEVKSSAVFEGIYLGCLFLGLCWVQTKSIRNLLGSALLWIFAAILPTLLIIAGYFLSGHWDDWYFANVVSIFLHKRSSPVPLFLLWMGILSLTAIGLFLEFATLLSKKEIRKDMISLCLLSGWLASAAFTVTLMTARPGFLIAFAPPVAASFIFLTQSGRLGRFYLYLLIIGLSIVAEVRLYVSLTPKPLLKLYESHRVLMEKHPGCLFEYGDDEMQDITQVTANCHLTRFSYHDHLGKAEEQGAFGIEDENQEVANILAQKPKWISIGYPILKPAKDTPEKILQQYQMIEAELQAHYRLAPTDSENSEGTGLFERKDGE